MKRTCLHGREAFGTSLLASFPDSLVVFPNVDSSIFASPHHHSIAKCSNLGPTLDYKHRLQTGTSGADKCFVFSIRRIKKKRRGSFSNPPALHRPNARCRYPVISYCIYHLLLSAHLYVHYKPSCRGGSTSSRPTKSIRSHDGSGFRRHRRRQAGWCGEPRRAYLDRRGRCLQGLVSPIAYQRNLFVVLYHVAV